MHPLTELILQEAQILAENRRLGTKIKSHVTLKVHQVTKTKNVARLPTLASAAAARLLIPMAGSAVAAGLNKTHDFIEGKVLAKSHAHKIANSGDNTERLFKFQIKELDMDEISKAFRKARRALQKFVESNRQDLRPTDGTSRDICGVLKVRSYKFYRARYRLLRLRVLIGGFVGILEQMAKWIDDRLLDLDQVEKEEVQVFDYFVSQHPKVPNEDMPTITANPSPWASCGEDCVLNWSAGTSRALSSALASEIAEAEAEHAYGKSISTLTSEILDALV
ncbi:MAG: hypothetical protein AAGC60_18615 [Acidobacteriota bacterium]